MLTLKQYFHSADSEDLTSLIKFSVILHLDESYRIKVYKATPPNGRCKKNLKLFMLKSYFCLIAGFCSISLMIKNGHWREKGDDLATFPDFSKKQDVELVMEKLLPYPEKYGRLIEEPRDGSDVAFCKKVVEKSTEMINVLSTMDGYPGKAADKNTNVFLPTKFWLGHEFIFHEHENFDGDNAFIFFDKISGKNAGFNLMVHPFENKSMNAMPSGGINSEGLKILLSKPTPVSLSHGDHYYLAEIEGIEKVALNTKIIYLFRFIFELMLM